VENANPLGLVAMQKYFTLFYDSQELDKKTIFTRLNPSLQKDLYFPFREVAEEFRLIEDETIGVIIPVEPTAKKLVEELRHTDYPRTTQRKLQQFSVALRSREFAVLEKARAIEMVRGEFPVLINLKAYDEYVGICSEGGDIWHAEDLIS
jgi:CRISPR-associated endonuclease/helicase Cas3